MSTATELLSRADEICSRVWDPKAEELSEEIRTFLAAETEAEPDDKDEIHQMQLAAISLAARGNWKKGDKISPKYETPALHDVAKLYADASKFVPEPRSWETHEEFIRELAAVNGIPIDENLFTGSSKPAEPEAEPVAYVNLDEKRLEWAAPFDFKSSCFVLGKLPLYFHPPRPEPARKPMTTYGKDDSTMQSMCRGDKE